MNTAKPVIYMADDDADDRYFLSQALQAANPSAVIIEAENGSDLLKLLDNWNKEPLPRTVPLILMDMSMPKMNGIEALLAIKANPALRYIPAVMISTSALPDQIAIAYRCGVNSYIKKPASSFDMNQIAQAINVCFLSAALS